MKFISNVSIFGQTGVTLFFVLSGFLITRILLSYKHQKGYFSNFYIRRSLRIFPLYYGFLFLYYFSYPFFNQLPVPSIHDQAFYFGYLQNFALTFNWNAIGPNHYWSLAVEEHFYLLWPLLVYYSSEKQLTRFIFFILAFSFLLRIILSGQHLEVFYFTFTRMDALALGALLSLKEIDRDNTNKIIFKSLLYMPIFFLITTCTIYLNSWPMNLMLSSSKFLLVSLLYYLILHGLIFSKVPIVVNRILNTSVLNYTGKISYGLYVFHPLAFQLINKYYSGAEIVLRFMLSFLLSYLVAIMSFELIEKRFLHLKKYFEYK